MNETDIALLRDAFGAREGFDGFGLDVLTPPQLWTVTDNINQAKGDKSPDAWKPPLASFYCTYAKSWVQVKHKWKLSITLIEKTALVSMIDTCQEGGVAGTSGADGARGLVKGGVPWAVLSLGMLFAFRG